MGIFESTSIPDPSERKWKYIPTCDPFPPSPDTFYYLKSDLLAIFIYISWNFCPDHTNTFFTQLFTCNNQTALLRSTRLPLVWISQSFQLSMYNQEKNVRCMWCAEGRRNLSILPCNLQRNHNLTSQWYKGQQGGDQLHSFYLRVNLDFGSSVLGVRTGQADGWRKTMNTKSPRRDH